MGQGKGGKVTGRSTGRSSGRSTGRSTGRPGGRSSSFRKESSGSSRVSREDRPERKSQSRATDGGYRSSGTGKAPSRKPAVSRQPFVENVWGNKARKKPEREAESGGRSPEEKNSGEGGYRGRTTAPRRYAEKGDGAERRGRDSAYAGASSRRIDSSREGYRGRTTAPRSYAGKGDGTERRSGVERKPVGERTSGSRGYAKSGLRSRDSFSENRPERFQRKTFSKFSHSQPRSDSFVSERAPERRTFSDPNLLIGRRALQEVLKHAPERVQSIHLRKGVKLSADLKLLIDQAILAKVLVEHIDEASFSVLCNSDSAQGIAARLNENAECDLAHLLEVLKASPSKDGGVILVIDQVVDPQNFGALLRTAEAFSVAGVIVTKRRTSPLNEVVRKASAGASELLPIVWVNNLHQTLGVLREAGVWVVGASLSHTAIPLRKADLPYPLALVVGSEGEGLRKLSESDCDVLLKIEMTGKMQSLNVAQATAVLLYHIGRDVVAK